MSPEELRNGAALGRDGVCVDICHAPDTYGCVRTIVFFRDRVVIEFNMYGTDEGGPVFVRRVESWEECVEEIERFLGTAIDQWENWSRTGRYPEAPPNWDPVNPAPASMREAFEQGNLKVPNSKYEQTASFWDSLDVHSEPGLN